MSANSPYVIKPVAPPQLIENAYTPDQHARLINLIRTKGPWQLILAQHFASPEEVVATTSGSVPKDVKLTWDMFLSPVFRGYLAKFGTCLHPEIEDCFLNEKFLKLVRGYWKADYAKPDNMLFSINGPCGSSDAAHIDATAYRGVNQQNAPIWLLNTMTKSGLFHQWRTKKAQLVGWFYKGTVGGGFTYWPEGPAASPKRVAPPMWNRAVLVENEMMYHRGESNGPVDQRRPQGLTLESLFGADPHVADGWQITTKGEVIQKVPAQELRLMVHWSADVFKDYAELKQHMEHSDDLTLNQVFEMFVKDLKARGHTFETPTDPVRDQAFIGLLTQVYDPGVPKIYPAEAPGPDRFAAA